MMALIDAQGFISGNQNSAFACALAINRWRLKCVSDSKLKWVKNQCWALLNPSF